MAPSQDPQDLIGANSTECTPSTRQGEPHRQRSTPRTMSAASLMHGAGLEGGHTVLEQADEQEAAGSDATLPRELEAARQALRASESKLQSNREQWAQATSDIVAQMAEQQRKSQALETKLRSELSAKDSALKEAMQGIGREQVDKLAKARTNEQVEMLLVTIRGRSCGAWSLCAQWRDAQQRVGTLTRMWWATGGVRACMWRARGRSRTR